ncbi:SUF system NifU family Fe-S cluster assembly protein [Candidatus Roizmanbacteria bacterium CG2_30_33_16]|uniref:SUF system NifU family Fe-S cluster assembly protein n=5 Tax=Candidatus Roizmaniibacteriota TaxID=1752723 RepID=A0A2M7E4R8_9BACT|nr:MAG: SUF system NifU family Fe-S cluster assembly protein [Candidatus Roizmanbacteria bacterium CG2_30_33_16]PIP64752.1 MAG: SUF system NifU family Fe-S cluster assembly protein [Candidatus Roizmanbacteria bacterium CG22_combo_CG10-13_8_21_14_all_33_16]PIV62713.1 MAG: SUF system NifU family Fe-S cluster assembly protein [Candidatus Roizmanbacteria bacterium CG01_land_8_20_14_3_00_33_9]PIX69688.1 MAG: SUF system NifU family Fe-S cluster assembly protein [Candidatus Roizmanbacteria bacterium CG
MNIYKETIIDHYQNPRNFGKLKQFQHSVKLNNPFCGDEITLYINIQEKKIKEISFQAKGCAISIASASLLTENVKGKTKEQLRKLNRDFIIKMLGIDLGINRLKCALLPLDALKQILKNYEF